MPYSQVFGGQNIFPSDLTLLLLNPLTVNTTLAWPIEQALPGTNVFADIIEVTPNAGLSLTMPDARQAAPGQACLVNNIGANTLTVKDNAGNTIGSVPSGQVWQFYLEDNTALAGVWKTFQFGTGVSSATAAALAGPGLKAAGAVLEERMVITTTNTTPLTLVDADRAKFFVWTGGVGVLNLPAAGTVGNDWFVWLRNQGSGDWTVTPAAGTVDGAATKVLKVGQSAGFVTDGTNWYSMGFGQSVTTLFDHTSINVAGTGTYVLGSGGAGELNRISYTFTGVLVGNRTVEVPATTQQYWVQNNTSGAFTLTIKTNAGTGVAVPQGFSMILACDGVNVVSYEGDPATGLIPIAFGGTGITSYTQGDILYATGAAALAKLPKDTNATRYLSNTGGSNNPAWAQVNLANGVSGRLPFSSLAQGSALSVLGVTGNVGADVASIAASFSGQLLRYDGAVLAFGYIDLTNTQSVKGATQGALIYGSAADQWSMLAKDTGAYSILTNKGTTNNPAWQRPRMIAQGNTNSDYTFALTDAWSWTPHTGAATQNWTVPPHGTVAFQVGDFIGIDNRLGAGALTIVAGANVTIDGHGTQATAGNFMVLPPGYKMLLIKMVDSVPDVWLALTDAPVTAGLGAVYAGYVAAAAASSKFNTAATGWTVSNPAVGTIRVTHGLGLSSLTDLAVTAILVSSADDRTIMVEYPNANFFDIHTVDVGSGNVDVPISFHAVRLA